MDGEGVLLFRDPFAHMYMRTTVRAVSRATVVTFWKQNVITSAMNIITDRNADLEFEAFCCVSLETASLKK